MPYNQAVAGAGALRSVPCLYRAGRHEAGRGGKQEKHFGREEALSWHASDGFHVWNNRKEFIAEHSPCGLPHVPATLEDCTAGLRQAVGKI